MSVEHKTLIGHVDSVSGNIVTVGLKDDIPTLIMIEGFSYRIGQIGAFVRIPIGYTNLYAVCTLVGAAATPQRQDTEALPGHRWLTVTLFGESVGDYFERGVSQYPTIEDEVHLVTQHDMKLIYSSKDIERTITVGHVAVTFGIPGRLDLGKFVTRHSAIVGSTGSGKSNLVAVLLEAIATQGFSSSRVLMIDPHGEYASTIGDNGYVFKLYPDKKSKEKPLYVPFWALPFDELRQISLGSMQPASEATIYDEITDRKKDSIQHLKQKPSETAVIADSPIPFSIHQLWYDLDDYERQTFTDNTRKILTDIEQKGNPEKLESNIYPRPGLGGGAPFSHPTPRRIAKQLELLKSRLQDSRFKFLFHPSDDYTPDLAGKTKKDLDELVCSWIGHDKPITVLDVSGLPSETLSTIVGTLIRIVYDMLFWATELPVGGRKQPLLIVLEEAHVFLPEGGDTPAHRTISKIAKEGRKYGVGLCAVTQRPSEIESTVLSQCGTMISLRLTNQRDRSKVEAAMSDDLGALGGMLPSLRTGEGLVIGEAMPIPSRIQFYKAQNKVEGDDPDVPTAWRHLRPDSKFYAQALMNWRRQSNISEKEKKENG